MALANKTFQRILRQTNKDISEMATARHIQQIRQADSTLFAMHMQGADQTAPNQQGGKRRSIAAGGRPRRSRPQKRVREQAEAMKRAVSSSSESDDEEDKSAVRKQPLRPIDVALNSGGKNKAARLKTPKLECDDVIILSPPRETPAPIVEIADVAPSAPEIAPNPPLLLPQPPQPQPPLPQPQPPLLLPLLPPPLSPPTQPASLPLVYREQPTAVNAQQRQSEPSSRIIDVMAQNRATNVSACQPTVSSADSSSSAAVAKKPQLANATPITNCSANATHAESGPPPPPPPAQSVLDGLTSLLKTSANTRLKLTSNSSKSMVVSMDINGVMYRGVLFADNSGSSADPTSELIPPSS